MYKLSIVSVVLAAALTGCVTTDPYTGEQKTSNTAKAAGIGAVAGAVAGAVINDDDRGKGAAIGAAAGAAIGGGIGYYMDQQEAALRERLTGTGVQVQRIGNEIKLVMPGNITFDTGRAELKSDFYKTLDSVAIVLKEFDQTKVDVSGHTDSTGSNELNQRLSENRAASVSSYLNSQGIIQGRITAMGYGPRYPLADNGTSEGRQLNRRVEIQLRGT